MTVVEKRGKNVEEATALALEELGATEDQVVIEVLDEPSKGLLGLIGNKGARVRVTLKESRVAAAERFLIDVTDAMGLEAEVSSTVEEGYAFVDLEGKDLGSLIGRHGQTLNALQYLANLASARGTTGMERIVLDVGGYRRRREETLRLLADRVADKVRRTGQSVSLEPMTAQERRVVHTALQDSPYVTTKSEGEDPYRRVVVLTKR